MTMLCRMDELRLPPPLDGSQGHNRARGPCQIDARDDVAAARAFLAEYALSPATHRSYQKEVERLILWAVLERRRPLSSLSREDFAAYERFLQDPQPRERWCGPRSRAARYTAGWRPFVGPLGPSARRTALAIVNSLMSYLVQAGYLAQNPLSLIRQRGRGAPLDTTRRQVFERSLDDTQWQALLDALEALPGGTEAERAVGERARFVLALLHFLALRVGEIERHRMGDFVEVRGRWVFRVVGKGRKEAEIPVAPQLLEAVQRYRESLGLSLLPGADEATPLVPALSERRAVSARRINQVLKELCAQAADRLQRSDPGRAERLRRASAHWFRHTALTRQWQKGIDLAHIKANARHAKLDTTLLYVHTEEDQRHEEIKKHTWR